MRNKYYLQTFGCQMNYSDSERFRTIIENLDYVATDSYDDADLIVFNSCSVRQKAEDRISGLRPLMTKLKGKNSKLKIILTGCMARRNWNNKDKTKTKKWKSVLKRQMPWLDFIVETRYFWKLPEYLHIKSTQKEKPKDYLSYKPKYQNSFQAFIPISTGCNHFCTYCIVPFTRGKEKYRSSDQILSEVKELISNGYKDITLLGQTVNNWRGINPSKNSTKNDSSSPKNFVQLLQTIDAIKGDWWFSFVSSHPRYMTSDLINFLEVSKHFRSYLHFAIQSGSDKILKKMNRGYTVKEFSAITNQLKTKIPHISISTDVIVGFPDEKESDFDLSAKIMTDLEFDMVYISEFSPRPGTAAANMTDSIPHHIKESRKKIYSTMKY